MKPTYRIQHDRDGGDPEFPDDDSEATVRSTKVGYDVRYPDEIVRSSGGDERDSGSTPLGVHSPAWKRWRTARTVKPRTVILHIVAADVIPIGESRELVKLTTHVVADTDLTLAGCEPLSAMLRALQKAMGWAIRRMRPRDPSDGRQKRAPPY